MPSKDNPILLVEIDPKRCKPWQYHNRDSAWLTPEHCADLIRTLKRDGQQDHILVRKLEGDLEADYEIIYGVRRTYVCAEILNKPVIAHITDLDDKSCMTLMHAENASSKDISEFERAYSFAQQMKSGLFKNQTEMAEIVGLSQGSISKMIKAAEILEIDWIATLFKTKMGIPIKPAYTLSALIKRTDARERVKTEALLIQKSMADTGPLPAAKVLRRLIAAAKGKMNVSFEHVILSENNKSIVCCSKDRMGNFSIIINDEAKKRNPLEIETACLKAIRTHLFSELFPGNSTGITETESMMSDEPA